MIIMRDKDKDFEELKICIICNTTCVRGRSLILDNDRAVCSKCKRDFYNLIQSFFDEKSITLSDEESKKGSKKRKKRK